MDLGRVPIQTLRANNTTIAVSLNGTAAATPLFTASCANARAWEVFNCTLRNLELFVGAAPPATAANAPSGIFSPGTASAIAVGLGVRAPINIQSGYVVFARTTEATPVTIATTNPLYINLWE